MIFRNRRGQFAKKPKVYRAGIKEGFVIPMAVLLVFYTSIVINAQEPEVLIVENDVERPFPYVTGVEWTEDRIIREIKETFPEDPETAVKIMECESGLDPEVQSQHILSYGQELSFGIAQIHEPDWGEVASSLNLLHWKTDVRENLKLARHIYDIHRWSKWTCAKLIQ